MMKLITIACLLLSFNYYSLFLAKGRTRRVGAGWNSGRFASAAEIHASKFIVHGKVQMYEHILVPTDGSRLSNAAVEKTLAFAKEVGARVTLLSVLQPFHVFSFDAEHLESTRAEYERNAPEHAGRYLAAAANRAKIMGVPCDTLTVWHEHVYQAIIDTAAAKVCDLISMASHGRRGLTAMVLGSETLKVLTHSKLPVLVYR
jgi:nucleotide-binding universal stress UspA family protein